MQPVTGIKDIIEHFRRVERNVERGAPLIAKSINDSWELMINLTDAIDSGDYLRSVGVHPVETGGELLEFLIDNSDDPKVTYGGLIEGGTERMPARFPAEKAIEREDFVSAITDPIERGLV